MQIKNKILLLTAAKISADMLKSTKPGGFVVVVVVVVVVAVSVRVSGSSSAKSSKIAKAK